MAGTGDKNAQTLSNRLYKGVYNNNIEEVRRCIDRGVDLTLISDSSKYLFYHSNVCPLALSCLLGHEEIMEALLKAGADPNYESAFLSRNTMHMAAYECSLTLPMLTTLIAHGADIKLADYEGITILHYLARGRFIEADNDKNISLQYVVRLMLDNGADFLARNHAGCTPLQEACMEGNIDFLNAYIAEGGDVNVKFGSITMLSVAIAKHNMALVDILLEAGADRHLTPADLIPACHGFRTDCITRILDTCDVDINGTMTRHDPGMTILHYAYQAREVNTGVVRVLIENGADVTSVSNTGDTALHYAMIDPDCRKIRQLLSCNPPVNIKNGKNQTPLNKLINSIRMDMGVRYENRFKVFSLNMLLIAGANVTACVEHELDTHYHQNLINILKTSSYAVTSIRSLKEMCRFVIRGKMHVPVDVRMSMLPIPKQLQEYLNFPEFDLFVNESLKRYP